MILVDTSIWIDHIRSADRALTRALEERQVLSHPFVIGEIALGNLRRRALVLALLRQLPAARLATNDETLAFIETHRLAGTGIGLVEAHLLASVTLTHGASLWSRDRRLRDAAARLKIDAAGLA